MQKGYLLLFAATSLLAQPTISNIETVRVTHSTVTIKFKASSAASHVRVRYGLTTSYEGSGSFPDSGIQYFTSDGYDLNTATNLETRIGGLRPATTYHFCPQMSADGVAYSSCVDHTETTAAVPAGDHPAYPTAPDAVDIARPDTSGYTVRAVAPNCSDLQAKIDAAAADQVNAGSIITIPAGTVCTGQYLMKPPSNVKTFTAANVNTSNSRITLTGHGLNDNDLVKIVAWVPPGSAGYDQFRQHRGFPVGNTYYARVIDENTISLASSSGGAALPFTTSTFTANATGNTLTVTSERFVPENGTAIQVVTTNTLPNPLAINTTYYVMNRDQAAKTFQISATASPLSAIDITDTGTGTHSIADQGTGGSIVKWPATDNWIIIRTDTADSSFVPQGVRVTPEFESKMATIRTSNRDAVAFTHDDLATNYRIEGIKFTHTDTASSEIATTINPKPFVGLIWVKRSVSNIIIDRCYFHGLGQPNRLLYPIVEFNAANSAIINSYWDGMDVWTPVREGMALTRLSNTQFTIGSGTFHIAGSGDCTLASTVTVTTSGSASGTKTGKAYCSMAGALTLNLPTGVSASCSPISCTVVNNDTPTFPVNGDNRSTVMPIGNLDFTNTALTAVSAESLVPPSHQSTYYGGQGFAAGDIGGKTALINNTISGAGIPVHYDDANGNQGPMGQHYTITRNLFITPETQVFSRSGSDKLRYSMRQQLEFKRGEYIKISGNIFQGVFADGTPIATGITISGTPGVNSHVSDVEISYNIFRYGSGGFAVGGGRPLTSNADISPPTQPLQRVWIHNNLVHHIDQYAYRAYEGNNAFGAAIDSRFLFEDARIEHNTFYDLRGTMSTAFLFGSQAHEGLEVRNNIFWVNGGTVFSADDCARNTPSCVGLDGKDLMDAFGYNTVWAGNSMIAGCTDASNCITARTSKTYMTDALPGLVDAYLQSEMAGNIEWRDVANGDFRLSPGSSHKSGGAKRGTDGLDRGANIERLEREVGTVKLYDLLDVTSSGATVPFAAPDKGTSCIVAYGTGSDPAAWTGRSSANTDNSYARAITLSGLDADVDYGYRIWCSGTAQTETRRFRTAP